MTKSTPQKSKLRVALAALLTSCLLSSASTLDAPKPYGALPSARQLNWHDMEFYGFIHFTINTFTDKEWGYGDENPALFNPGAFDADQIVASFKAAGMTGIILTAKHHDGFCLWPSEFTEHSVKNSPWKEGRGDMVREISDACRKHGLKFGVYLSPWDRNHKDYARPGYVTYFHQQLRELLTHYGPIFEVWFDGAMGGDGYHGGARGKRTIKPDYYQDEKTMRIIRELQPEAMAFNREDCRWVGNEKGIAGDPCWATFHTNDHKKGNSPGPNGRAMLNQGVRNGPFWWPAEADVSIRPGWFWHERENAKVKSPRELLDLYLKSVGRGATLLLNVPPDRRGRVHENDVKSLTEFGQLLREIFADDLAARAAATASDARPGFPARHLVDGDRHSYWASHDEVATPEVTLEFNAPVTFNLVRLREFLPLGQRIDDFALDIWADGCWLEFHKGTAIGPCRLVLTRPLTTTKVRLRITKSPVCPALSTFELFHHPALSELAPATLPYATGMSTAKWKLVSASHSAKDNDGARAFDGKPATLWHTSGSRQPPPHSLVIDLGQRETFGGFFYLPRQDGITRGNVDRYAFHASDDGKTWGTPVLEGEFANIVANPIRQIVTFQRPITARYIQFVAQRSAEGDHVAIAEMGLLKE